MSKLIDVNGSPIGTLNDARLEDACKQIVQQSSSILAQITSQPYHTILLAGNAQTGRAICYSFLNIDQQIAVLESTLNELKARRGFAVVDPSARIFNS